MAGCRNISTMSTNMAPRPAPCGRTSPSTSSCWRSRPTLAGYFFVLAVSNVGYIIFNFLNLNAGWIHRAGFRSYRASLEGPHLADRPQHGACLRQRALPGRRRQGLGLFANALWVGFIFAALILPVFAYRHYVRDGGKFRPAPWTTSSSWAGTSVSKKAGILPYLALAGGLAIVLIASWIFQLPA